MDTLKEFIAKQSEPKILVIWFADYDDTARVIAEGVIEEGHTYAFKKGYHARFDRAVAPNQQDHLHVMLKDKDICVINKDGSPSHKSDLSKLPGHVKDAIRQLGVVAIKESAMLLEQAAVSSFTVPKSLMLQFTVRYTLGEGRQ